jgi:hypothetical protein
LEKPDEDTNQGPKVHFFNELAWDKSGGARARFGPGGALGAKISVQRIDGCVQNQVAIGAGFQMEFDLAFDGRGEPPL